MKSGKISVILPTYNEAGNIVGLIQSILANIPDQWEAEIIPVDDNSPDGTYQKICSAFPCPSNVLPILRTSNRGLANSIRAGIEKATGDKILVMDTDFSHDPVEIPKMLIVSQAFELVCGSRFCQGGNMDSKRHYYASLVFNWWVRLILRTQIQDNLSGFFLMDRNKLRNLPFDRIFSGYGEYFFRLLHFAQSAGYSIVEIPVFYKTRTSGTSKSNFLRMIYTYSLAMMKLKISSKE